MRAYIIRRLALMVPTIFLVTIIVFGTIRLIPGSAVELMVVEMQTMTGMGGELTEQYLLKALGLDVPVHVQYGRWLGGVFQGDLGKSLWKETPVVQMLGDALPVSIELGILAVITAMLFALPIGIFSAIRQDTAGDYGARTIAILAISVPSFWLATMVITYGSIYLNWIPSIEYVPLTRDPFGSLEQFLIPGVLMGLVMSGTTMRMTRTMMLEVLRQDYIRTAWAKGLNERAIIFRHALKNAFIPLITMIGMMTPLLISGAIVIEQIFALPGVGRLQLEAINRRDYPIISGINLVLAGFIMIINLLVDLSYAWLDPRVKYN